MSICLMANIPDKFVLRGVVDIMKSNSQFYCAKTRTEMAGILGTTLYHILSDFLTKCL